MAHILVIDDEFEVRNTIRFMLEREGHKVTEALDGVEGIQYFLKHSADLIITDILMPNQDGIETLLQLHVDHPEVPVIVISGNAPEHLGLASEFGAHSVLSKPFKYQELINAVSQALET
ncbi:MAG: response regulator [Candidatus Latescibacteria bacterium]|jgi:CheY-like chemotaxis protein|nr:response regulator [Candidatus Latescibacterota bacterium]MBT5829510.1 response regulator [Candidatus Latescibacterota bacterium]